ncbi:amidohydrolase [candidate division WOR-3 bacterium]|nr:amidohydrolase [candidate division WOR-3 bacterium]
MEKRNKILLVNGRIFLSDVNIEMGNILIEGEKIKEIYSGKKANIKAESIDLEGRMVIPGFIDAHTHLLQEGIEMMRPDLSCAESPDDVLEIVRDALKKYKKNDFIIASNFDESKWENKKVPSREELDRAVPDNPLVIRRVCGHIAVANSLALEKIPDVWRGVDRKTGIMKEDVPLNISRIFPPDEDEVRKGLRKAVKKANNLGITSIHEIVKLSNVRFYEELGEEGGLTLNVRVYIPIDDLDGVRKPNFDFRKTVFGGVKIFGDGSIGARTAANTFSYKDSPGNKGLLIYKQSEFEKFIQDAEKAGIQLMIHAIGNKTIKIVLNAYENYLKGKNPLRHRMEHCELIDFNDIERMRKLGIIASMQPNFIYLWSQPGGMYEQAFGKRFKTNNPIALLKKNGITVAFGSDSMPLSPLLGIEGTVTAPFVCQRMGREEAIKCYTKNSAFAGFSQKSEGEITIGKEANLVVLDSERKKIYLTFYRGRCVYSS